MALLLYEKFQTSKTCTSFKRLQEISLAGKYGPVANLVSNLIDKDTNTLAWSLTHNEIVEVLSSNYPQDKEYFVVIDLKPKDTDLNFYFLKNIHGFSYENWTPVCIELEEVIPITNKLPITKDTFTVSEFSRIPVYEFLYMQGGISEGSWNWGRVGGVNGALLWPDALKFFLSKIKPVK